MASKYFQWKIYVHFKSNGGAQWEREKKKQKVKAKKKNRFVSHVYKKCVYFSCKSCFSYFNDERILSVTLAIISFCSFLTIRFMLYEISFSSYQCLRIVLILLGGFFFFSFYWIRYFFSYLIQLVFRRFFVPRWVDVFLKAIFGLFILHIWIIFRQSCTTDI